MLEIETPLFLSRETEISVKLIEKSLA